MHRSGTSVLTGVLGGLGLALPRPDDRWGPEPSNPEHFESLSMCVFDERLFEFLEGSWDGPPDLPRGWAERPELEAFDEEARRLAGHAFPEDRPVVWKDPRSCLLLPYWRRLLPEPLAAVLMWRAPTEVARSLRQRDGFSWSLGMALWEHYNRAALDALEGTHVYVMSYEELLGDPEALCNALAAWLDSLEWLGPHRGTWDLGRAAGVVTHDLRHQRPESDGPLLGSQGELVELFRRLRGAHASLPAANLAPPSIWGTAVLEEHRKVVLMAHRADAMKRRAAESSRRAEAAHRAMQSMRASRSWRMTRPLRALSTGRFRRQGTR